MDENKTALVKKIGEGNKSLSVIVAEDKLTKFKRFSQSINLSMGYLLNQAIDRYLANNSTEIFSTSTGIPTTIGNNTLSVTVRDGDIEELVNTTIKAYLLNNPVGYLSKVDIEELINTTIESKLDKSSIGIAEVDNRITPLIKSISELETYSQDQFKQVREELRAIADTIANPTTAKSKKDPNIKTWAEFFEMVGIKPMRANEAQGKETDTRTKQIEQGIQAAKEQFLGEWAINVVGRSFVRVDATVESPLPLSPN
ncbi:hypothetical protein [Chamaesiphon sp.]|uniref:hypothetical protein n=1 Tax=Chamaesiphon sp. TaxID=2814140 RepID=UPI003594092D